MKKLTKEEMKKVMGGTGKSEEIDDGSGRGCIEENDYACSVSGHDSSQKCCPGLRCVMNATDTGTICVI